MPEYDHYKESNRGEETLVRVIENGIGALTTLAIPRQEIAGSPEAMVLDTLGYFISFANILNRTFLEDNKGERQISRPELYLRAILTGPVRATAAMLAPTVIAKAIENHDFISSPWGLAFLGGVAAISLYETGRTLVNISRKIIKPVIGGIKMIKEEQRERKAAKTVQYINLKPEPEPEIQTEPSVKPDAIALSRGQSASIKRIMEKMPPGPGRDHSIEAIVKRTQR